MQIGWVDFSKTERDKVVSILRLLGTQTALDELGIGTVRDAFSDMFFPGISTLQTTIGLSTGGMFLPISIMKNSH